MILVIDNYDSFVYNLVQYVGCLEPEILVVRNDALSPAEAASLDIDGLLISPGPGEPRDAGVSKAMIATFAGRVPVLGVCLGLQCIAELYGGRIVRAALPMHGKLSPVHHGGDHLFAGLPSPVEVMRYHSLVAADGELPACLEVTARTLEGEIMGLRHRDFDLEGLQFHPESVFTQGGARMVENFVARVQRARALRRPRSSPAPVRAL